MSAANRQLNAPGVPAPRGHFSQAVRAGDTVYVSGLLALGPDGEILHAGDIAGQTKVIFENLELILLEAGGSLDSVVRLTTYVTAIGDRAPVNAIRGELFGAVRPASTLVEVSALAAQGAVIEIDAIAVVAPV